MSVSFSIPSGGEGPDIIKQNFALKVMLIVMIVLTIVLFGLLISFAYRYENVKMDCQNKLDYWADKCADKIPGDMVRFNISVNLSGNDAILSTLEGQ